MILYVHFPLWHRNLEKLLKERSVDVGHDPLRYTEHRSEPMLVAENQKRRILGVRSITWLLLEFPGLMETLQKMKNGFRSIEFDAGRREVA